MRLLTPAALLVALLAAISIARADDGSLGKPLDTAVSPALQWKEQFGFTSSQYQRYSAVEKNREDALRPLREQLRDALLMIRTLVADKATDGNIAIALDELARAQKAAAVANKKFDAELTGFLSPTQRAKMLIIMPPEDLNGGETAARRTGDPHEALTDGDLEQE